MSIFATIKRALTETSAEKCTRVGHRPREYRRTIFFYPAEYRTLAVADEGTQVQVRCTRCYEVLSEETKNRRGIQGLTMSDRDWDQLKAEGRLVI